MSQDHNPGNHGQVSRREALRCGVWSAAGMVAVGGLGLSGGKAGVASLEQGQRFGRGRGMTAGNILLF